MVAGTPQPPLHQRAATDLFLSQTTNLAYLVVPKAACTALKWAVCELDGRDMDGVRPRDMHGGSEIARCCHASSTRVPMGERFTFTFVREPIDRFLAFYRNKILLKWDEAIGERLAGQGFHYGMPVQEAVDALVAHGDRSWVLDPHVIPQYCLVYGVDGRSRCDFVGRLEQSAMDLGRLQALSGHRLELKRIHVSKRRPDVPLDPPYRAKLRDFYAPDYELFDYR